jgi:hypothetical protein
MTEKERIKVICLPKENCPEAPRKDSRIGKCDQCGCDVWVQGETLKATKEKFKEFKVVLACTECFTRTVSPGVAM